MTKLAIIISGILLFAGVATAGSLTSHGQKNTPTIDTGTVPASAVGTTAATTTRTPKVRREDRKAEARGRANEPGEDVRGPCDEPEHTNDPRCAGVAAQAQREDDGKAEDRADNNDDHAEANNDHADDNNDHEDHGNSGPGNTDDRGGEDNSGHGGGGGGDDD